MQVIPAIDLRDGACVQLVGGSYADERVRLSDPVAVAQKWTRLGFSRIHLVDLDAATGRGSNRAIVREILATTEADVQCGGGVRDLATIEELLSAGASEVVLGTRAVEDRVWLEQAVARFPDRIIVAADTSKGHVVSHGWSKTQPSDVLTFIDGLQESDIGQQKSGNGQQKSGNGQRRSDGGHRVRARATDNGNRPQLAAVLVTAVDREGRLDGPDLELVKEIAARSSIPLQASGGVRSIDDIRALANAGAAGAIIGMALYTGALDPEQIIEEISAWA
jgi:phosphoribosylformimino-5-aminoimidazole carboxamide ribotide isomerase